MTVPLDAPHRWEVTEAERLNHLRDLGILDTPPDLGLERIVERARDAMPGTTIAAVSLVDVDRQWFKAQVGLLVTETPRTVSFCSHAIQGDRPFVIEDATKDDRFARNPLVTSDPGIRFYVGMPLIGGVGALCVIGLQPRSVTAAELKKLESLAGFVNARLSLHAMNRKLHSPSLFPSSAPLRRSS